MAVSLQCLMQCLMKKNWAAMNNWQVTSGYLNEDD